MVNLSLYYWHFKLKLDANSNVIEPKCFSLTTIHIRIFWNNISKSKSIFYTIYHKLLYIKPRLYKKVRLEWKFWLIIPRDIMLSASTIRGRNKWRWRGHRCRRKLSRKFFPLIGMNRRWWIFNESSRDSWSLSLTPFQQHITTTTTWTCAVVAVAMTCLRRGIKRGHVFFFGKNVVMFL